jgi:hypothetical protein
MKLGRFVLLTVIALLAFGAIFVMTDSTAYADCEVGQEDTNGCFIAGTVYGNTSNAKPDGTPGIVSSWSPGPWVCGTPGDCSGPTDPGGSVGDFVAPDRSNGHGNPQFANGNDQDIDFSSP